MLDLGGMARGREDGQLGFDLGKAQRPLTPSRLQTIHRSGRS